MNENLHVFTDAEAAAWLGAAWIEKITLDDAKFVAVRMFESAVAELRIGKRAAEKLESLSAAAHGNARTVAEKGVFDSLSTLVSDADWIQADAFLDLTSALDLDARQIDDVRAEYLARSRPLTRRLYRLSRDCDPARRWKFRFRYFGRYGVEDPNA